MRLKDFLVVEVDCDASNRVTLEICIRRERGGGGGEREHCEGSAQVASELCESAECGILLFLRMIKSLGILQFWLKISFITTIYYDNSILYEE